MLNRNLFNYHILAIGLSAIAVFSFSGCMSVKDGNTLKKDMFEVNTRLVALESLLADKELKSKKSGQAASRILATSTSKLDQIERNIQLMKGEIDTLRVGVVTGKLPGQADDVDSIADSLTAISERLVKLEETQGEILTMLDSRSKKSKKSKGKKRSKLKKLPQFKSAFKKKRYKQISEEIASAIKNSKGMEKRELQFLQAESLFKLGNVREAALKFNKYSEFYPSDKNIPHVQMRMGDCFRYLGDKETASIYYSEVVGKFPNTESASTSKKRLADIKKKKG